MAVPMSVAQVVAQASNYTYNGHIPLANWLRTASTMQKEAHVYEAEGNDQQVYLLLYRHADLVLEKLQAHPDKSRSENRRALAAATATVMSDLRKLEDLAPRIKQRHDDYCERRARQLAALQTLEVTDRKDKQAESENGLSLARELDGLSILDRKMRKYDARPTLDAHAHETQSIAARLAQREVQRRGTARRGHEPTDQRAGTSHLSEQLQEVARLQQGVGRDAGASPHLRDSSGRPQVLTPSKPPAHSTSPYRYPSIPHKSAQEWPAEPGSGQLSIITPTPPPKEQLSTLSATPLVPPPVPPKPPQESRYNPGQPPPIPGKHPQNVPSLPSKISPDRPPTPSYELDSFTFQPTAYLENGEPLRPVFLPSQLRQQFLSSASTNTRLNLETCGILCGILKSNALFITRLLIPEQTSTSDTCETLNEEELFDYCDKEELMVLGWIHTHPTQTCFMSSRDLHTHVGYQVMMPESIAIVCAPTKTPSWGCFRLTDPPGKQAILNCSRPGIFHPHDVDNIYTEAMKPGHVIELMNAPLEVVDMRSKRNF